MNEFAQLSQISQQLGGLVGEMMKTSIKAQTRSAVNQQSVNWLQAQLLTVAAQTTEVQQTQELLRLKGLI